MTLDECHEASREFRKKSSRPLLLLGLALAVYHLISCVSMPLPWPFVKAESKGGILQQFACTQCPSLWLTHGFPNCQSYDCGQSPLPHFLTLRAPKQFLLRVVAGVKRGLICMSYSQKVLIEWELCICLFPHHKSQSNL